MVKEMDTCRLIKNAKTDPNWDYELNAKLCNGNCDNCDYYIKNINKEKINQLAKTIEILEKLKEIEPSEKWISVNGLIDSLKEEKAKLENNPIEKEKFVLWYNNEECPNCGKKANQEIRACETGMSYCSEKCAKEHVNNTYTEEED